MFGGLLERYEGELGSGGDPRLEEYVDVGSDRYWEDLFELLQVDIDLRTRRGEDVGVWKYLVRFPGLEGHVAWVAKLLELEVTWRRELGLPVNWKEYWDKYPSWRDKLGEMFWAWDLVVPEIPGYDLRPVIAKGGMGAVFSAWDRKFEREVAIKVMKPGMPEEAFQRESRVTARLQHPGIPPVHDRGKLAEGLPYLVMKLIQGETLEVILQKQNRQGLQAGMGNLLAVFERICQAVGYAHSQGVIHRDLKPFNVMVGSFGEVQVMDWGLSRETSNPDGDERSRATAVDEAALTVTGQVKGTPAYMAPEQARGEVVDPRADVFALGGILLAILTGRPPFDGGSSDEMIARAAKSDLADALDRLKRADADPELRELCRQCLAPAPADRPADGTQLAEAVGAYRATLEERLKQTEMNRVRDVEQRKRHKTQRALAATALLLAIAASFAIIVASLWQSAEIAKKQQIGLRKENARANEYCRMIRSAHQEWNNKDIHNMRSFLNNTDPFLRDWEWGYLNRICQGHLLEFENHSSFTAEFSQDGTCIVSSGMTGFSREVKIFDARTRAVLITLSGNGSQFNSANLSPDGTRIVTSSQDIYDSTKLGEVKVWDSATGTTLLVLKGHGKNVLSAFYSRDGTRIVTASLDKTARIWDAFSGNHILTIKNHDHPFLSADFSPDGTRIITTSGNNEDAKRIGEVKVWNSTTGTELLALKGHSGSVLSASYSLDGTRIVTSSRDKTSKIWDANTGINLITFNEHTNEVNSARFSPDGSCVVTSSTDGSINIWNSKNGLKIMHINASHFGVTSASFSPDGKKIIAIDGGTLKIWDANIDAESVTVKAQDYGINSPQLRNSATHPMVGSWTDFDKMLNARSGIEFPNVARGYWISPDGTMYATWDSLNRDVTVWDAKTRNKITTLKGHSDHVSSVCFSFDGARVVTGSWDKTAKVWNTHNGAELFTLSGHTDRVVNVNFNSNRTRIVTGSWDKTAKVWNANTGVELFTLNGHESTVSSANFSSDDSLVATSGWDGTVRLWDIKSGFEALTLRGHVGRVNDIHFNSEGTRLVTGSDDGAIKVWDTKFGLECFSLFVHPNKSGNVDLVSFSTDDKRICAYSNTGTGKIWDSRTVAESVAERDAALDTAMDKKK